MIATALRFFSEQLTTKVKMITKTTSNSALFLLESGEIYAVGSTANGTTGLSGATGTLTIPTKLPLTNVIKIASTRSAVYALTSDGALYQWGKNEYGFLLTNTGSTDVIYDTPRLTTFAFPSVVKNIISCQERFYVICENGSVYGWGQNSYYQLGKGTNTSNRTPTLIINVGIGVKKIIGSFYNTLFLKDDGTVYGCGFNAQGNLGMGHTNSVTSPTQNTLINGVTDVSTCANSGFIFLKSRNIYFAGAGSSVGKVGNYSTPTIIVNGTSDIKFTEDGNSVGYSEGCIYVHGFDLYIIGVTVYKDNPQYTGVLASDVIVGSSVKINSPPVSKFFSDAVGNTIIALSGETFLVGNNLSYQLGLGHNATQYQYSKIQIA